MAPKPEQEWIFVTLHTSYAVVKISNMALIEGLIEDEYVDVEGEEQSAVSWREVKGCCRR